MKYNLVKVDSGQIDLDVGVSFTQYVFPIDRTKELFEEIKAQADALKSMYAKKERPNLHLVCRKMSLLRRYIGAQKVEHAANFIRSILAENKDQKIAVFAIHADVIEGLRSRLREEFLAVTLYSGTRYDKAFRHLLKFQTNKKCRVLVCNIAATQYGGDLSAADHAVFVEQEWNPELNGIAAHRCLGQKDSEVLKTHHIILKNSIDEMLVKTLIPKKSELTETLFQHSSPTSLHDLF